MRKPARKSFMRNNSIQLILEHVSSSKHKEKLTQVFTIFQLTSQRVIKLLDSDNLTHTFQPFKKNFRARIILHSTQYA